MSGACRSGSTPMAWQRSYYYKSVRINGRPRHWYFGHGPAAELAAALAGPARAPLERLLAERVALCWLRLHHAEMWAARDEARGVAVRLAEFHDKHLTHAHRRFLSAVKTLATVRRLALPVLVAQISVDQ